MKNEVKNKKIAAIQAAPVYLNKDATVEKACDLIRKASRENADMVVFPEAFISGYPDWIWLLPNSRSKELNELYIELTKNSVSAGDGSVEQLCKAARENNIYVVIGINEINSESSGGSLYNSLLYIDEKGNVEGIHRKLIPTGGERLIWARGDGNSLHTFETSFGKLGGLICWENFMPLARQAMYDAGVQILAAPTWDKSDNWLLSLRHIAREGGMFVVGSCMALRLDDIPDRLSFKTLYPEGREWINTGKSCIINPKGEFIAGPVEGKEEIIYADINLEEIVSAKRMFDVSGHYSRPDVFKYSIVKDQISKTE